MDQGMILLIKLDKGKLKGAGDLLGSLLMAKLQMAAFSRSDIPQNRRRPFHLYVDEFQNFTSDSFEVVLSEARKYGLSLVMAHQTLGQISNELRSLILGNAGIQVYFRLNRQDSQILAKEIFEYSGYEVKTVRRHSVAFWSYAEEWERKTAELQNLAPRLCFAKHKIQGGCLLLHTADMNPAWRVLGMRQEAYERYLAQLPFGRNHLVSRRELPQHARRIPERVKPPAAADQTPEREREPERDRQAIPEGDLAGTSAGEGKGGRQHRYLQGLIKRIAEENGYRAIIEKPILDGQGQVDISLERDDQKIACEVSVTTSGQQEFGNVEKCLAAGYDEVILCSADRGSLRRIETHITAELDESARARVRFLEPEQLLLYLGRQTQEGAGPADEQRVRGYKVKVQHQVVEEADEDTRREAIAEVIVQSLRRLREEG